MSEKKGFFKRLAQGLSKTRDNIASSFDSIFSGFSGIDEDFYEELEEILIMSDMGIDTTMNIIEDLKKKVKENKIKEPEECRQLLIDSIKDQMRLDDSAYDFIDKKSVVLVIGVNGVGKTTSVGKLAASLKGQGKKVLLMDADPQGNATSGLGINKEQQFSVYDVLIEDIEVENTLQSTIVKHLDLCPSNINLAGAEVQLVSMEEREYRLKKKIDNIKDKYDFIIIDCPPSLGLVTLNAFTASDSVLIPIQCEYYALEGLGQLLNTIDLVKKHMNKSL